jgi:hypothetical protein
VGVGRSDSRSDDRAEVQLVDGRNEGDVVDSGFQVALYFVALGILWLFISAFLLGIFEAVRKLLG